LAQIQFVQRPPVPVPRGPSFASAGDFDNDGFDDAVISTNRDDTVVILLGSETGEFVALLEKPVGTVPADVTTLDFNQDGDLDVGLADERRRVFWLTGNGDGSLTVGAGSSIEVPAGAEEITSGNFDNARGPDLASANGRRGASARRDTISVLLNRGGNLGFEKQGGTDKLVGGDPSDIEAADFNSDGLDDLAVLDTGAVFNGADAVLVMLNPGGGAFDPAEGRRFVVGVRSVTLKVGDFNDDSITDIAVINENALNTDPQVFTLSVLLNRTRTDAGELKGTGFFDVLAPFPFNCPATLVGVPVRCRLRDLGVGDFDGDGLQDLAVSMSTVALAGFDVITPGVVSGFLGLGTGQFEFSTQVPVGVQPRGLAVGDINGNTLDDIIVTEFSDNTVRTLITILPPPRPNGSPCRIGSQCESGACVDGICCASASCPFDQRCDIPGSEGECANPGPDGSRCTIPEHCESRFCVDGFCCDTADCPPGEFCNTGTCGPPAPPGFPCDSDDQCETGFCVDGFCCTTRDCPFDERCDIPGNEGICTIKLEDGEPCGDRDEICLSGFCTDGFCCEVDECAPGFGCGVPGREGVCSILPTPTPTPTPTSTATLTPTPQPNGFPCAGDEECISTFCVDGVCCSTDGCPPNEFCNLPDEDGFITGDCRPRKEIGEGCNTDADCLSGNCELGSNPNPNFAGICAPPRTPTPTPLRGPGEPCGDNSECQAGFFCNDAEGICCNREECPEGQSCKIPGDFGFCTNLPTPTPTARPLGAPCNADVPNQCESTFCWTDSPASDLGTCCSTPDCPDGQRCDITGEEGNCFPQRNEGDECGKASDCEPPLQCLFNPERDKFLCTVARPTATPITPPPATPTPGVTVRVSRSSGGCAIDRHGTGAGGAAILALLPLLVGVLRRQQVDVVRSRHRRKIQ
jgi:hypothetical protein